jgi:hypothetical protein
MKSLIRLFQRVPNKALLIAPQLFFWVGAALNQLVLVANNGQMPVLFPGGCNADIREGLAGSVHTCLESATHLKFLIDFINLGRMGIWSLGDVLITIGDALSGPLFWCWLTLALLATRSEQN